MAGDEMHGRLHPARKRRLWRILILVAAGLAICVAIVGLVDRSQSARINRQYHEQLTADVKTLAVDGIVISYREMGVPGSAEQTGADADAPSPPLLLIHGFMGSSYDFHAVMPGLAEIRPVIAVDLPGFGLSDKSPDLDYSKQRMADLLLRFMSILEHDRFDIMGHSMGGEIALRMTLTEPQHMSRLVLLSSGGSADIQRGFAGTAPEWLLDSILKSYLVQRLYFPLAVGQIRYASAAWFDPFFFFNRQIPAATLNQMTRDNDSGQIAGQLKEISQPTLLVWGDKDRIIPLKQGQIMNEQIPDSRLIIYENCGHLVALERSDELLDAITKFFPES